MNKIKFTLLFSLAFAISCSNEDGSGPICSNVQSITVAGKEEKIGECYEGSSAIVQILCETGDMAGFQYQRSGSCPSGEKTHCSSNFPFPGAILHEYGESLICDK